MRDATARYYRWRRNKPASESEGIKTELCGTATPHVLVRTLSRQINLRCGCRVNNCSIFSHSKAIIGGKRFTPGESLIPGKRCGSVIVRVVGGSTFYGLVKRFVRVICDCVRVRDFVVVTWFPKPVYPDGDPVTVHIYLNGSDVNNLNNETVVSLFDIQPCRVVVLIDRIKDYLSMMRIEGTDIFN